MPSPDLTPYINLRIFDKDPQDLFEAALLDLQTNLPLWVPREGNIEVLLLEALALEVSEAIFAVNRLPDGIVEVLLQLFGITRDNGAAPVFTLQFDMVDSAGYTIPVGTTARLNLPGGLLPIIFTTSTELVIAPSTTSGTVSAVGDRFTEEGNSTALLTELDLMDGIIAVDTVKLSAIVTAGREPESDSDYFTRATTRFTRLSDTLVLPDDFSLFALENPIVNRAKAFDNWDGSGGAPGDDPGHITVAVYGDGAALSTDDKVALEASMEAISMANLDVHVIDPTITPQDVTATVKVQTGQILADVEAACAAAVTAYLDPMQWAWSGTLRVFELVSLLDQVPGVDYVVSITTPASDVTLPGVAGLPSAGTITITAT